MLTQIFTQIDRGALLLSMKNAKSVSLATMARTHMVRKDGGCKPASSDDRTLSTLPGTRGGNSVIISLDLLNSYPLFYLLL